MKLRDKAGTLGGRMDASQCLRSCPHLYVAVME